MRRILLALTLLTMLLFSASVRAAPLGSAQIAVLPFTSNSTTLEGMQYYDAVAMSSFLTNELSDTRRFRLVEADRIDDLVDMQSYNAGMLTNKLIQMNVGNLLQAQYVIIGEVLGEGTKTSELKYSNSAVGSAGGEKYKVETMVSLRMVDVETGEILYTAIGRGASSSTGAEFTLGRDETSVDTPIEYDEYGNPIEIDAASGVVEHTLTIGSRQVGSVQFLNAVTKAISNALTDKNTGMLAKIDGTDKRSRSKR